MGLSEVSILVFWVCVQLNLAQVLSSFDQNQVSNYISWKDLSVDEQRFPRDPIAGDRVIVVDQHGRGHSRTVQGAVDMVPDNNSERIKIYIYPGIYREKVYVPRTKGYVSMIGGGNERESAVITWNSKSSDIGFDGQELGTYDSATVTVESDYFCATRLTFENSVEAVSGGDGMQGVALRVDSERAMFYRVRIKGEQDTLLDNTGTHYFYQCQIQGKIDFIFGNSKSLYQNCDLHSVAETYGAIAAHHRDAENEDTGFSFVNCSITGTGSVYLGRAWGDYSRIIYSLCYMDDIIIPEGWTDWNHTSRQMYNANHISPKFYTNTLSIAFFVLVQEKVWTAVFGEYQCEGIGADRSRRVKWSKFLSNEEARPFLDRSFINGDQWLNL